MPLPAGWKDPSERIRLVADLNQFAYRLLERLVQEKPEGNLFFSPSSIATVLAMAHAGASGETRAALAKLLGFSHSDDALRDAFRDLTALTAELKTELLAANRLWVEASFSLHDDYLREIEEDFRASLVPVDFRNEAALARQQINAWVDSQTRGRVRELIPPGGVSEESRLVLTNAVYFLGAWHSPFEEANTNTMFFSCANGKTAIAPMMYGKKVLAYGESEDVQVLEMTYERHGAQRSSVTTTEGTGDKEFELEVISCDVAMEIMLPRPRQSVETIVGALGRQGAACLPRTRVHSVDTWLPKFSIEDSFSLADTLGGMSGGRPIAVDADFSRITDDPRGLFISDVIHKAFVDVNEHGTEASAASARMFFAGFATPPPAEFKADRPFLFCIKHIASGLIHFMGHFAGPTS